jgi:uncharacterized protein YodC (DUF2158 family)
MDDKNSNTLFKIGDIVRFVLSEQTPHLVIEGIELNSEKEKKQFKYRCRWFVGQKSWEFKEAFLLEETLQLKHPADNNVFQVGQQVKLTTCKFEMTESKKNGFVTQEPTIYQPPAMVIIALQTSKKANEMAKCLYYNLNLNKFSEIWIPSTSLCLINS